jgi:hypothetical protein
MTDTDTTANPTMPYANADGDPFAALGVVSHRIVDNSTVDIPANVRKVLATEVTYFSGQPNTTKRELVFPDSAAADLFRAQIKSYAKEHDLGAYLPVEDKFSRKLNAGNLVTYRFSARKDISDVDTSTVTVSKAADLKLPAPAKVSK